MSWRSDAQIAVPGPWLSGKVVVGTPSPSEMLRVEPSGAVGAGKVQSCCRSSSGLPLTCSDVAERQIRSPIWLLEPLQNGPLRRRASSSDATLPQKVASVLCIRQHSAGVEPQTLWPEGGNGVTGPPGGQHHLESPGQNPPGHRSGFVDQALAAVAGFHRGGPSGESRAVREPVPRRPRCARSGRAPNPRTRAPGFHGFSSGAEGGQQVVAAASLAVELVDVLRPVPPNFWTARDWDICGSHAVVITASHLAFACLADSAEAVFVDCAKYSVGKRAGIKGARRWKSRRQPGPHRSASRAAWPGREKPDLAGGLGHAPECSAHACAFPVARERGKEIGECRPAASIPAGRPFHGDL